MSAVQSNLDRVYWLALGLSARCSNLQHTYSYFIMHLLVIGELKGTDPTQSKLARPYGKLTPFLLGKLLLVLGPYFVPRLAVLCLVFLAGVIASASFQPMLRGIWLTVDFAIVCTFGYFLASDPGVDSTANLSYQTQSYADYCSKCKNGTWLGKHCPHCDVCIRGRVLHCNFLGKCIGDGKGTMYDMACVGLLLTKAVQCYVLT